VARVLTDSERASRSRMIQHSMSSSQGRIEFAVILFRGPPIRGVRHRTQREKVINIAQTPPGMSPNLLG
jgi:hypothetical protein